MYQASRPKIRSVERICVSQNNSTPSQYQAQSFESQKGEIGQAGNFGKRQQPQTQQQASIEPLEEKTDKNASGQLVLVRAYEVAEDVKAMMHRKLLFSVPVKYNDGSVGRGTNCGSCVCVKTNLAGEMVPRAIVNDVKGYVQCILLVCDEGKAGATAELNEGDMSTALVRLWTHSNRPQIANRSQCLFGINT